MTRCSIRKPAESVRSRTPLWDNNLLPLELDKSNNVVPSYSTIEKIYLVHSPSKIQLHSPTVQSERHTYSITRSLFQPEKILLFSFVATSEINPPSADSFRWRKYYCLFSISLENFLPHTSHLSTGVPCQTILFSLFPGKNNVVSSYSAIEKINLVHCPSKIQLHSPTVQSERHTYSHPSHATSFGWRKY
jgi:hypothetical protein